MLMFPGDTHRTSGSMGLWFSAFILMAILVEMAASGGAEVLLASKISSESGPPLPRRSAPAISPAFPSKPQWTYEVVVLYDAAYGAQLRWKIRIDRGVRALNEAFKGYDIFFKVTRISEFDFPDSLGLQPELFRILAQQKNGTDIVILFSGRRFPYVSGKASENHSVVVICAQPEELEKAVIIHEVGHLFGLEHVADPTRKNYMLPAVRSLQPDHFVPENEELIRLARDNGLDVERSPELVRRRLSLLQRLYTHYETDHFILVEIGNAHFQLGEYTDALDFYRKALVYLTDLQPGAADSTREWLHQGYRALGITYRRLGQQQEAISAYRKALQSGPGDSGLYAELAWAFGEEGRWREAVRAYEKVTQLQPDFAEAHCNLGVAYSELGEYDKALQEYSRAIRLKPDFTEAYRNLGVAYSQLERWREAASAFREVSRLAPNDVEAYLNLGLAYSRLGEQQQAIDAYREAIRIDPGLSQAHQRLGIAYARLGRYRQAVGAYKEAIRLDPRDAQAHYNLGMTYLVLHDPAAALSVHERLKALNDSLAAELMKRIQEALLLRP